MVSDTFRLFARGFVGWECSMWGGSAGGFHNLGNTCYANSVLQVTEWDYVRFSAVRTELCVEN